MIIRPKVEQKVDGVGITLGRQSSIKNKKEKVKGKKYTVGTNIRRSNYQTSGRTKTKGLFKKQIYGVKRKVEKDFKYQLLDKSRSRS